ncbi:hypothetical protein Q8F55_003779 [Vanrija albida]|uniref:Fungal-type protein kinase domain-containing protein n=1 Tax=Vanrija albida TaxID=181172 RepID=A0ABR3Q594_9TREE
MSASQWGAPPPVPPPRTPTRAQPQRAGASDSSPCSSGPRTPVHDPSAPRFRAGLRKAQPRIFGISPPDPELVRSATAVLRVDQLEGGEAQLQEKLAVLVRLPYEHADDKVQAMRELELKHVSVATRDRLDKVALHTRLLSWLAAASTASSASSTAPSAPSSAPASPAAARSQPTRPSPRRPPTSRQLAAYERTRGIRQPDIAFVASMQDTAPATYTVSGVMELKSDVANATKGLLQTVFYVAQAYSLAGAQLGIYFFRTRFVRVFALSPQMVAVEELVDMPAAATPQDATDQIACRLAADEFLRALDDKSNAKLAESLPWNLRAAPGWGTAAVNWDAVSVLGDLTLAAWDMLLDLPAAAPLRPFAPTSPARLAELGLANAAHRLPLLEDERARTAASFVRRALREERKGSKPKAASTSGTSSRNPDDSDDDQGGQGGAGQSSKSKGKRRAKASPATRPASAKRKRARSNKDRGASATHDDMAVEDAAFFADDEHQDVNAGDADRDRNSDGDSDGGSDWGSDGGSDGVNEIQNQSQNQSQSQRQSQRQSQSEDTDDAHLSSSSCGSDYSVEAEDIYLAFRQSALEVVIVTRSTMDELVASVHRQSETAGRPLSPPPAKQAPSPQLVQQPTCEPRAF